jgi:anti-sigma factor RsiW
MSHDIWLGWLDAYVDGSCTQEELEGIEDHLRNCPACATDTLGRLQMKIATRAAAVRYTPSAEFRTRLEKRVKVSRKPLWEIPWVRAAAAAAAVLLLAVVGFVMLSRQSARNQAVAQLLDIHVATTASTNPVDVVSTDQHTVKPWFQGKLPYTFNLPDLTGTPFKLQGGRMVYFRHNPGAQLVYDLHKHEMSAFILQEQPGVTPPGAGVSAGKDKGFNTETWSQGGLRYVVVSDAAPGDVHALGDLLRAAGNL